MRLDDRLIGLAVEMKLGAGASACRCVSKLLGFAITGYPSGHTLWEHQSCWKLRHSDGLLLGQKQTLKC